MIHAAIAISLFISTLLFFVFGAIASLVLQKYPRAANTVSHLSAAVGSSLGLALSAVLLLTKTVFAFSMTTSFPLLTIAIRVDSLSALFIGIISVVSLASSLYGMGYMRNYYTKYSIGMFGFFYNLFILSLLLVASAYNGLYFIFVWEIMSLTSLALVTFEHKDANTIEAGYIYFIMTHVATAFITIAFFLIYQTTQTFDFAIIKQQAAHIPFLVQTLIFICCLLGFGTKAGIIPLHIWLPRAHSAAPSHVSALMSGVMIKMAIFMFFRIFLDLIPSVPLWLGVTIVILGGFSSVLGVLYALSEHDSKRLLAYHSIENIGIILLGLGTGIIFLSLGNPVIAAFALTASLFHTVNHAIFKSLLFLAAGSVIAVLHTRNMEEYGGLIKRMPYTSFFFLIGAIAISGFPPFNGFVSEWLTFQGLFTGIASSSMLLKSLFIFAAGSLAFTGGLAAACFVKAFGVTFLARARNEKTEKVKEVGIEMVVPMGLLAVLCLALGVFSGYILPYLQGIIGNSFAFSRDASMYTHDAFIQIPTNSATLHMPAIFLLITVGVLITWIITKVINPKQKEVSGELWDCGYTELTPRMEITATGFSRSLIIIFRGIFKPSKQHTIEYVDADLRYFATSSTVTVDMENLYEKHIYYPLHKRMHAFSLKVRSLQGGTINNYLLYILIMLLILLLWARYS